MNHQKIYAALIDRAHNRTLEGYSERHHVLPRCMGGGDDAGNIVRLTPEEHFLAHQLLIKMHPEVPRLVYALLAMTMNATGARMDNKLFGWMRRRVAEQIRQAKTGVPCPDWVAEKIRVANTGRKMTDEQNARNSLAKKGRPHSPEHNAKVGRKGRKSPMTGRQHSEETKAKMRAAALARKHTPETIAKLTALAASQTQEARSARAFKAWETKRAKKELTA